METVDNTPNQVDLVEMSFERVRPIREAAAALFYQRLFELNPSSADSFGVTSRSRGTC